MFKVAAASALVVASAADVKQEFVSFMTKFNKQYSVEQVAAKFAVFEENLKTIQEHNSKGADWFMAVNEFTDLTASEFSALYKGLLPRQNAYARSKNEYVAPQNVKIADSLNWVTKGAVTPVKDQGQCGSCWAFSTTGGVEAAVFLKSGTLTSVSEQQLVDCSKAEGNQGCNGGLMDDGFEYIIKNGGIGSESSYKYTAKDGTCKSVPSVSTISKFTDIKAKDEAGLMTAIQTQPISIAVDAQIGWQTYGGGVLSTCTQKSLDHGVLLVGYGTDAGKDYWLVKNSWGQSWGESGFIRLKRNMDSCGLADAASFPTA